MSAVRARIARQRRHMGWNPSAEGLAVPVHRRARVADGEVGRELGHSLIFAEIVPYRWARLTADTTARSEAVTMFGSMPTPHRTRSPTAHST